MRLLRFLCLVVLALLAVGPSYSAGTVTDCAFFSPSLNATRHMMVYTPEGYDPDGAQTYPVIYFLHPANCDYNTWPLSLVVSALDNLITQGLIHPTIAAIPSGSVGEYGGSLWANSALYGQFESYVVDDVRAFVETNYRVIPERAKRALIGYSMGGFGAFNIAFRHPDLFAVAGSHSGGPDYNHFIDWIPYVCAEAGGVPPYHWDPANGTLTRLCYLFSGAWSPNLSDPPYFVDFPLDSLGAPIDSIYTAKWLPNGPQRLTRSLLGGPSLAIYFDCGTNDDFHLFPFNTAFAETLTTLGIPYEFKPYTGNHSNRLYSRLLVSFAFADSVMMGSPAASPEEVPQSTIRRLTAWPNPAADAVTMQFRMPSDGPVDLDVLDVHGRLVERIARGLAFRAGEGELLWKPAADCPAGVYYARLRGQSGDAISTIVLAK
jgi:enterochelin esterase-like enzyme